MNKVVKKIGNIILFVDESGTLPDPKDKVIIVAAVGTYSPEEITKIIKAVRKKGKFRRQTGEVKFYTVGEKSKSLFFQKIIEQGFEIFVLIVEKRGRVIPDTPEHFGVLCGLLLKDVFAFYSQIREIVFDRHFHKDEDIKKFNQTLKKFLGKDLPKINHVDSKKNQKVNVADMIAGAVLAKETGKNKRFYEMFSKRIVSESRLNWPEAKRKLFGR